MATAAAEALGVAEAPMVERPTAAELSVGLRTQQEQHGGAPTVCAAVLAMHVA